jgi:phage tail-like protein
MLYGIAAVASVCMLVLGIAAHTEAAGKKSDNGGPYSFNVEIDGVIQGGFKEISGLESEIEVVEYKDGSDPITHKRAGQAKYKNITLTRDVTNDALTAWYEKVLAGKTDRKSGSVIYLDRAGQEVLRYKFFEAWPCRWKAPELNSSSDTKSLQEQIEICVEKIQRI